MEGTICKRDILAHPIVTIRSFGWRVFFKALLAGPKETFLSLLIDAGSLRPATGDLPELIRRCVRCEVEAMQVYQTLAQRFPQPELAHELFATLARHEQGHADMLEVCRVEAIRAGRNTKSIASWQDAVPRVQQRLDEVKISLDAIDRLDDALQIVVRIESSEINKVFSSVVATSESDFVRALKVFRVAGAKHLTYICQLLPRLEPSLRAACQELVS